MSDTITINKAQLADALTTWEQEARAGKWPPRPDLTPEQIGAESANYLWGLFAPAEVAG